MQVNLEVFESIAGKPKGTFAAKFTNVTEFYHTFD